MSKENNELRRRLQRAEAVLDALQSEEVDAVVGNHGVAFLRIREVEQKLRDSEERLRLATEIGKIGTWRLQIETGILEISEEGCAIYGLPTDSALTLAQLFTRVHPEDIAGVECTIAAAKTDFAEHQDEYRVLHPDGAQRWVQTRCRTLPATQNQPSINIGVVIDITVQKMREAELIELNESLEQRVAERTAEINDKAEQLRGLANELSQAEQLERKRLARVLHDHIQQLLVAARMRLTGLQHGSNPERIRTIAQGTDAILKEAMEASRSLTVDLSPPILHESGLISGLKWLAVRMQHKNTFTVHLNLDNQAEPGDEAMRFLLFECVRELLFNALKHAAVPEAELSLFRISDDTIKVLVTDRGKGFDPGVLQKRRSKEMTFGLFSIQERLLHLGGATEVESAPARGTTVTLTLPCAKLSRPSREADGVQEGPLTNGTITMHRKKKECRVLIVDDHKIMRDGLARLLQFESDIEVAGEAADGPQARKLAEEMDPDVVIMDINLGAESGIEVTRQILAQNSNIKVIALSMHLDKDVADAALDAGAVRYLTKGSPSEELLAAIRACR